MPVINSKSLDKYKTYYEERVKGKDGITRPLTKVKYVKSCPQCGGEMQLDKFKKGSIRTRRIIRWICPDSNCKHSELEESQQEYIERIHNC